MNGPTVAFATLGCRLNQVDTGELQAALEARGFRAVPFGSRADVVVVNTCSVTSRAEFSDRQTIQRAVRRHPGARVVVTGCWAQTDPDGAARLGGVDLVAGNGDKHRLPALISDLVAGEARPVGPPATDAAAGRPGPGRVPVYRSEPGTAAPWTPVMAPRLPGRSRAFVKVQEGCQHRCAFCIVPVARGASRSREPKVVLDQVRLLVESGHPEVVLTGVDLGHYGADLVPRTTLAALLRRLAEVPGLRWVRLSSLLPAYVTDELLEVVTGSPVIAPHMHVPLQSGSDRVLRRMHRPYRVAMFRALVERLAAAMPDLGLGSDLIVGFPGESAEDFAATTALVEALPFTYLHVFAYSDRKGTEAVRLDGRVDPRAVAARSQALRSLARTKNLTFRRGLVGTTREALVLGTRDRDTGRLVALTGTYVEVVVDGPDALMGRIVPVRIEAAEAARTLGVLA